MHTQTATAGARGSHGLPGPQSLQDLQWCLQAPSLLADTPLPQLAATCQQLAQATRALRQQVPTVNRLGHYYEQLWQMLLSRAAGWSLVAADRQISHAGQTLGALDLLHWDRLANTYRHTELAVKFYLRHGDGSELNHWFGPNAIDRLDIKLDRLKKHQLTLPDHPSAQLAIDQWLLAAKLPSRASAHWRSQLIMQGWLFHPFNQRPSARLHAQINGAHLQGQWLHHKNAHALLDDSENWLILPKLYWLARANIEKRACIAAESIGRWSGLRLHQPIHLTRRTLPAAMLAQTTSPNPQPLLVVAVNSTKEHWQEVNRFMLVADNWPQTSTR